MIDESPDVLDVDTHGKVRYRQLVGGAAWFVRIAV
jgi:hypothetical protein